MSRLYASMKLVDLIDVELWNQARWKGVVFGGWPDKPPFMALAFVNGEAGQQIFRGLRDITGPIDTFELIRVAIIEGDIPGEDPGYTVHIGPNLDGIVAAAKAAGSEPPGGMMILTRIHRMNPTPGSPHLARFKGAFAQHQRYSLLGASISATGQNLTIDFEQPIGKTLVIFKHVSNIGKNDIDKAIFVREASQRPH